MTLGYSTLGSTTLGGYDHYRGLVNFLLHSEGASIVDYSDRESTVTTYGNTAVSALQSVDGTQSIAFDGTGDYLSPSIATIPATGAFTVEGYFYLSSLATEQYLFSQYSDIETGSLTLSVTTGGNLRFQFDGLDITTPEYLLTGQWYFLALSRDTLNNFRLFIDTNKVMQAYSGNSVYQAATIIGARYNHNTSNPDLFTTGYMDFVRVTDGVARYLTKATPPLSDWYVDSTPTVHRPRIIRRLSPSIRYNKGHGAMISALRI